MIQVGNVNQLPENCAWKDRAGLTTLELSKAVGSERLNVNLDIVPPGAYSTRYHSHTCQEEFFFIVEGTGTLRRNEGERLVTAGEFIAKPAGKGLAHTFYNSGDVPLKIMDIATMDAEDTCHYPDEGMYLHKAGETRQVYSETTLETRWTPEPNPQANEG